jgi:VWFA-related protein
MRLLSLVISLLAVTGRDLYPQEPSYRFERRVDVVAVDIAVTDDGRPVAGLTEADFELRDNGVLQEIDGVQVETAPVDAILVLDHSMSVAGPKLRELRAAVDYFVAGLRNDDRVALVTFSGYVRLWQDLTTDRSVLLKKLGRIVPSGLTSLKDGLYGGLTLAKPPTRRPIVVLFSDGLDNASLTGESELLEVVRESNAVVYVVCSAQPSAEATRRGAYALANPRMEHERFFWHGSSSSGDPRKQRKKFLRRVADDGGGQYFEIDDASSMKSEFRRVAEDIRARYLLTYYPTGVAESGWHDLEVKLKRHKGELRARQGYYVEPSGEVGQ